MKTIHFILPLLLGITITSCGNSAKDTNYAFEAATEEAMEGGFQMEDQSTTVDFDKVERKLIKRGDLSFETDDLDKTRDQIIASVKKYKGYISSDRENKYTRKISRSLEIRVPSKYFDEFLADATKGIKNFDRKTINVEDVTEEFVDVEARLTAKKEMEKRYLELLKEAKNVSEMLDVERELGKIRADIESFQGRLNYLKSQVSYSTIDITYYEQISKENKWGGKFSRGFRNGWEGLIYFFVGLVNAWPFLIIGGLVWYFLRRWLRKKKTVKGN